MQNYARAIGEKLLELSNHLGNVAATTTNRKINHQVTTGTIANTEVDIDSYEDYYSYGMLMEGRSSKKAYRYSFQGQERDDEVKGKGNSVNYTYRMHDTRLGRFFAVDPLWSKYPHNSTFAFSENRLIDKNELEGLENGPPVVYQFNQSQLQGINKQPTVLPAGSTTEVNGREVVVVECTDCNSHWDPEEKVRVNDPVDLIISQSDFNQLNNQQQQGNVTIGGIIWSTASGQIFQGNNFSTNNPQGRISLNNSMTSINTNFTDIPNTTLNVNITSTSSTSATTVSARINMIRRSIIASGFSGTINFSTSTTTGNVESLSIQATDGI
jgi:RHS repeat-associated protein